ncbi:MAG: ribosome silencing factor [Acidobacteriota bacterium]
MNKPRSASKAHPKELPEAIEIAVAAVEDLKGTDVLVLDLRRVASFTDYLMICTGSSDRHAQALVDAIREKLRAIDQTPLHTEGYEQASWVLIDFVDFLVNVFTPEARGFYQLERVWRDAPVLLGERPEGSDEVAAPEETDAADG